MSDLLPFEPSSGPISDVEENTFLIKPEFKPKSIRSFVIRAGRITAGQKNAFDLYWPRFGLSLLAGRIDPHIVFGRIAPLIVEIGFGMGDSLLQMARNQLDKNFIGIEVHPPGVGRLLNIAGQEELKNLRVFMADATDVLDDCIPDGSVDRVQIYFPDPWHKKKHHKRRIVQPEFIEKIHTKLKINGILHLATDWQNYAEYMMDLMSDASKFVNLYDEKNYAPRPEYRPITKFETRGERLGHGVWDLLFKKL